MATNIVTMRCKAFSPGVTAVYTLRVDDDGTARVYDSVAGHYTVCHSLGQDDIRRARKIANKRHEEVK